MNIKCIAIDDEPLALKKLVTYINKIPFLELKAQCHSAMEAQRVIDEQEIQAIFLDINMPNLNGMDFAKSLDNSSKGPVMVFTTAYSEYAIEGYKANAVGYLLKPYSFDEFEAAAQKVREICEIRQQAMTDVTTGTEDDGTIFVKSDYKIVRIGIDSIRYIEAMSEYLKISCDDKDRPVIVLLSMKRIEEHLPSDKFMRIHRSFIINLNQIVEVKKNHVILEGDVSLPIGDNYKDTFMNYLNKKLLSK
ncbi:MAG: response regulator transcription factor [Muribaculaceae bacterium]|nr:response regulator transcription factor [Muribaculaceae bacterium]